MVVGVVMGDDHAVHVTDLRTERAQPGREDVPGRGVVPPGVDEDRTPVGVEEVDQGVAERVVRYRHLDGVDAATVVGHLRRGWLLRHGVLVSPGVPLGARNPSGCTPDGTLPPHYN